MMAGRRCNDACSQTLELLANVLPEARHRRVDAGLQLHQRVDAVQRHLQLFLETTDTRVETGQ